MITQQQWKLAWAFVMICGITANTFAFSGDPCGGESALLSIVDRPTVGDSACVVPYNKAVLEFGYQYQKLRHSSADQQNFPEATVRIGLPYNNELVAVLPNYILQSSGPRSGFAASTLGIKHEIGYTDAWLAAIEGLVTLQGGNSAFGRDGTGGALNAIVEYDFNPTWSLSFMFGVTSQVQSQRDGGQRFTSFNPDLVLTYALNPKINFYGEVYGQSKTGPGESSGFNADAGILYLLMPTVVLDLEVGQRISGNLGGFNHYIGAGISIEC